MMIVVATLFAAAATPRAASAECPSRDEWSSLGETRPFPAPDPMAVEANATGKRLYRERRWDEARSAYRSALARDPSFLGPQLNVACSFVRQERFDEAIREVLALLARAYVPWAREVREAADLSALRPRPDWATIERATADAAATWGAAALEGIVYLARSKPAMHMKGQGTFLLAPRQELVAYVPATRRHLPLTTEDGRVLAFSRSADGRRIAYVVGGKLVRDGTAAPRLRDLGLRMLELPSMRLGPLVPIEGDATTIELGQPSSSSGARVVITSATAAAPRAFTFDGAKLVAVSGRRTQVGDAVTLDATGARGTSRRTAGVCGHALEQVPGDASSIVVRRPGARPERVDAPFGAALAGLPFDGPPTTPR